MFLLLPVFFFISETLNYYTWSHNVIFLNRFVLLQLSADFFLMRSGSQTIIIACDDAILSAGVCDAAPRSGRWTLKLLIALFSCLSLQRCQSRCGVPHRRLLEYRRGELHQGRALCLQRDRRFWCGGTLGNAGLYWNCQCYSCYLQE